jgi:putative phosphoribosyl transferase
MYPFHDRYDAGRQLAMSLSKFKGADAVVYTLPRGGVLVGYEVAKDLAVPLDVVIVRKIGHPLNDEYAICAITERGERICNEIGLTGVDPTWIANVSHIEQKEAERRRQVYKGDKASVSAKGKIAIIVDDGIATSLTMQAAIVTLKKQKPQKIIVAVPVAPQETLAKLRGQVDEVVVLVAKEPFRGSVGAYYAHFPEVFDTEVQTALSYQYRRPHQSVNH